MTIQDLIASGDRVVTENDIKGFEERVVEREKRFDEELRKQSPDDEFMARSYNL